MKTNNGSNSNKRSGFTLVELLVVIAIIALLLSILMPSLQAARASAKKVVCASNTKQLLLGLTLYDQDARCLPNAYRAASSITDVPPDGWWFTSTSNPTQPKVSPGIGYPWFWQQISGKYVSAQWKVYRCPASTCPAPQDTGRKDAPYGGNYGCNVNLMTRPASPAYAGLPATAAFPTARIVSIRRPANVALMFDSGGETMYLQYAWAPAGYRWYIPGCSQNVKPGTTSSPCSSNSAYDFDSGYKKDLVQGRHPKKKINIGWADGSMRDMTAEEFAGIKGNRSQQMGYWGN